MIREYPLLAGGAPQKTLEEVTVKNPFNDEPVGVTFLAGEKEAEDAVQCAVRSFDVTRKMSPLDRALVLHGIVAQLSERAEEFARTISLEAGKPIANARQEVQRSIFTFQQAGEETKRLFGEIIPLDIHPLGKGHLCHLRRFPIGPVLGITPFNFPLNLVAHKVAPAIAAGNPIVIKPAPQTPLSALLLGEIVRNAGWPAGAISVLPASNGLAERMVGDDRFRLFTFTGSPAVGWRLKNKAGKKRVALELGGNAGVIVHDDADLQYAAERITVGGFGYQGQSCISVQRVFVQRSVYERFRELLVAMVAVLKTGDPLAESTVVGPLISPRDVERIKGYLEEAVAAGAKVLCGGNFSGRVLAPTVLENTKPEMKVNCMEIFGPVVTLTPYEEMNDALKAVNTSEFGLQAGVFTNNLSHAFKAWEELEVGGVVIGNVPTFRMDHMPYGGVKNSGLGREGLRWAIEEMTEPKTLIVNLR